MLKGSICYALYWQILRFYLGRQNWTQRMHADMEKVWVFRWHHYQSASKMRFSISCQMLQNWWVLRGLPSSCSIFLKSAPPQKISGYAPDWRDFYWGGGGEIRRGKHFCEICHFSNWLTNFYLSCPVWSLVLVVLSDVITEQILSFKFCRRFKITSSGDLKESCGGVITYRQ